MPHQKAVLNFIPKHLSVRCNCDSSLWLNKRTQQTDTKWYKECPIFGSRSKESLVATGWSCSSSHRGDHGNAFARGTSTSAHQISVSSAQATLRWYYRNRRSQKIVWVRWLVIVERYHSLLNNDLTICDTNWATKSNLWLYHNMSAGLWIMFNQISCLQKNLRFSTCWEAASGHCWGSFPLGFWRLATPLPFQRNFGLITWCLWSNKTRRTSPFDVRDFGLRITFKKEEQMGLPTKIAVGLFGVA